MIGRPLTLEELMKRFSPEAYIRLAGEIGRLRQALNPITDIPQFGENLGRTLQGIRDDCERLELAVSVQAVGQAISLSRPNGSDLSFAIRHVEATISSEMSSRTFLLLEPARVSLAFEPDRFGSVVASAFPSAGWDIEEAARCLAFDRSTASVFHLMKVMEWGLHALAADLDIPKIEENWNNAIEQIEKAIRSLGDNKPSKQSDLGHLEERRANLSFYSDAATHFRYVKDAWRNHTTHVRRVKVVYTEEKAQQIFDSVKGFMQSLATRLKEDTV